jgi:hypothetical protein
MTNPFEQGVPEQGYQGKATPRELYREGLALLAGFDRLTPGQQDAKLREIQDAEERLRQKDRGDQKAAGISECGDHHVCAAQLAEFIITLRYNKSTNPRRSSVGPRCP